MNGIKTFEEGEWGFKTGGGTTVARIWKIFPMTSSNQRVQDIQMHFKTANDGWDSKRLPISKFYQYPNPNSHQLGLLKSAKESYETWRIPMQDILLFTPEKEVPKEKFSKVTQKKVIKNSGINFHQEFVHEKVIPQVC
jgi:hypothetical protein